MTAPCPGIDLHCHSTASDGSATPTELVELAVEAGIPALALTDHDTVAGLDEFMAAGERLGLRTIRGCELAVSTHYGSLDILGYFLPERPERLMSTMVELNNHRKNRNKLIVERLVELGKDITYEDVEREAAGGTVGRPHIAKVLLAKGYVKSVQEAFEQYIADNGKAHVPKKVLTPPDAIALLREEGASVSLAHPGIYDKFPRGKMEDFLRELKGYGLDAVEAYYPEHDAKQISSYCRLARSLDLLVTGGSDYHGDSKPKISLGRGKGGLFVPPSVLDDLVALRESRGLPV